MKAFFNIFLPEIRMEIYETLIAKLSSRLALDFLKDLTISTIVFHRAVCSSAQVPWLFSLRQIMYNIVCISWKEPVLQDYHVVKDDHEQRIHVDKMCANIKCCQKYNF